MNHINNKIEKLVENNDYFIYDLDGLYNHAKNIIGGNAKIFFACKANPLSNIINTLDELNFNFDVASEGELSQILKQKIDGSRIILTGPVKSEKLLCKAIENRIGAIVIESKNQLDLIQKLTKDFSYNPKILIRLQLKYNDNKLLNQTTQFGVDINNAIEILKHIKLPFIGFHIFQWNNILDIKTIKSIWNEVIKSCKRITEEFDLIDVGGGIGIPYNNEKPIKWNEIDNIINELKCIYNLKEFWLEMGRYLVGPYGKYITKIIDKKTIYNKNIILLRGGINHIVRPALINEYFPIKSTKNKKTNYERFSLHGPLCSSLDYLGDYKLPKNIKIGDNILFEQVGAYGFTESMPFFLCHDLPGEIIIKNEKMKIVRKSKNANYWLK